MLTTLIVVSSSFARRARAGQPNGVEGYSIREVKPETKSVSKTKGFSLDQPISGIISPTLPAKIRPRKINQ